MPPREIPPVSNQSFDLHEGWFPESAGNVVVESLESRRVNGSIGHQDYDSEGSEPDWQPSPIRFRKFHQRLPPSSDEDDDTMPRKQSQPRQVPFDDSDGNDDEDSEDGEDRDDTAGLADDIQRRRRKFRNDELDDILEMFRQFEETKVKPCAERLGCTVTRLMRIGKWTLSTPERRQRGNPWNGYLNLLKGL
jgi:hypothetical protein